MSIFSTIKHTISAIFKPVAVEDVFTPTSSADLNFIRRQQIEDTFGRNYRLKGRNIIVYGPSGSGKTTFLNRFFEENSVDALTIQCDTNMMFDNLLSQAFDSLDSYYRQGSSSTNSNKYQVSGKLSIPGKEVGGAVESSQGETINYNRLLAPQLSVNRLAVLLGEKQKVLVIEDFHKMPEEERKKLADMIKAFMDCSNNYPTLRVICVGASNTARDIVKLDSNLKHRIYECEIPLLSNDEIKGIVEHGCQLLNIEMEQSLVEKIVHFSNRMGTIAHELCYNICCAEGLKQTSKRKRIYNSYSFSSAIEAYLDARSDTLIEIYERAIKDSLGWYILRTFSLQPHSKLPVKTVFKRVNNQDHPFTENQVALKLFELSMEEVGILRNHYNGSYYSISDPFWGAYIKMRIAKEQSDNFKALEDKNNPNLILQDQNDVEAMLLKILLNRYKVLTSS